MSKRFERWSSKAWWIPNLALQFLLTASTHLQNVEHKSSSWLNHDGDGTCWSSTASRKPMNRINCIKIQFPCRLINGHQIRLNSILTNTIDKIMHCPHILSIISPIHGQACNDMRPRCLSRLVHPVKIVVLCITSISTGNPTVTLWHIGEINQLC